MIAKVRRWFKADPLRRSFRNAGVLSGGQILGGLFALGALALAARGLGAELFGTLVLIQAYVQLIAGLVKFQSWQALIHYGARCLGAGRTRDFQGLVKFATVLDLASAVAGTAIAAGCAGLAGAWFDWPDGAVPLAALYSVLILFSINAAPMGVLRLFDRFDLLSAQKLVAPALRLLGVGGAFLWDAGFATYVVVWLVSGIAGRLALVAMGWRELARRGLLAGLDRRLRGLTRPHERLWRFVWSTNLSTSLEVLETQASVLAVGLVLDPTAAGLFKIAHQFASVVFKPVTHLTQAIYPELARLAAQGSLRAIRKLALRAGAVAGAGASLLGLGLVLAGEPLIRLTVGADYVGAHGVLVLIVLAKALAVFGFALSPVLMATGRPHVLFAIKLATTTLGFALLVLLLWQAGVIGAGIAVLAASLIQVAVLAAVALPRLAAKAPMPA